MKNQPLNYNPDIKSSNYWNFQYNTSLKIPKKSYYKPLYTTEKDSQSITVGSGVKPIPGGIKEDGKLLYFKGSFNNLNSDRDIEKKNNTMKSNNNSKNNTLYDNHLFDTSLSGTNRSWNNSYNIPGYMSSINNDDQPDPLEAGPPDLTSDENNGSQASIPQYQNQGNSTYNVLKNNHPSDSLGSTINMLSNVAVQNINNSNSNVSSQPPVQPSPPSQPPVQPSPPSQPPVQPQNQPYPSFQQNIPNISNYSKNYLDDNQNINKIIRESNKTPININVSCNQAKNGYVDEYGYGGYGTPNLYNNCVSNNRNCYGNTLQNWYGDMSASNNVYRRRQQWNNRDFYRNSYIMPNNSLTQPPSTYNEIGKPYSNYIPYSQINQKKFNDKAKNTFDTFDKN